MIGSSDNAPCPLRPKGPREKRPRDCETTDQSTEGPRDSGTQGPRTTRPQSARHAPRAARGVAVWCPVVFSRGPWSAGPVALIIKTNACATLSESDPRSQTAFSDLDTRERKGPNPKPEMIEVASTFGLRYSAFFRVSVFGIRIRAAGGGASYLWLLLRSWSHATSGLLGEATSKLISTFWLMGGVVRASTHRLISAWPSANRIPAARP